MSEPLSVLDTVDAVDAVDTELGVVPSEGVAASLDEEILFEIQVTNGLLGHCYSLLLCMVIFAAAKALYRLVKHNVTDHIDF